MDLATQPGQPGDRAPAGEQGLAAQGQPGGKSQIGDRGPASEKGVATQGQPGDRASADEQSRPDDQAPSTQGGNARGGRQKRRLSPEQLAAAANRGLADILEAIGSLARRMERLRSAQASSAGLRTPAYNLLGLIAAAGERGTTVSEAAFKLGVRPQGLSGAVAELVKAGLIQRGVDATDGRARRLRVTGQGRAMLAKTSEFQSRLASEVLKQVPHPAVAKLVLSRLDAAFRQALEDA